MKGLYLPIISFMTVLTLSVSTQGGWNFLGLEQDTCLAIGVYPGFSGLIFVGTDRGTYRSFNGGDDWDTLNGLCLPVYGFGFDPRFDCIVVYGTYGHGSRCDGIYKSTSGGDNWEISLWFFYPSCLAVYPRNPDFIYAGSFIEGVAKTTQAGTSWSSVNQTLADSSVWCLAVSPQDSNLVYAGTPSGVYRSNNGGEDWNLCPGSPIAVASLLIDPDTTSTIYATMGAGTRSDGLYITRNEGESWELLEYMYKASTFQFSPLGIMYLASLEWGVERSTDGESWTFINDGLSNTNVHCLAMDSQEPRLIYAGTDQGVWSYTDTLAGITQPPAPYPYSNRCELFANYPNPFNSYTQIPYHLGENHVRRVVISIFNISGERVRTLLDGEQRPGYHTILWDGKDEERKDLPSGIYFCHLRLGRLTSTRKLVLIR